MRMSLNDSIPISLFFFFLSPFACHSFFSLFYCWQFHLAAHISYTVNQFQSFLFRLFPCIIIVLLCILLPLSLSLGRPMLCRAHTMNMWAMRKFRVYHHILVAPHEMANGNETLCPPLYSISTINEISSATIWLMKSPLDMVLISHHHIILTLIRLPYKVNHCGLFIDFATSATCFSNCFLRL